MRTGIVATSPEQHSDPLHPVLRDAEAELTRRLHEACEAEANGVADASATEIRELEDALLAAAAAAEHTLSLRRRLEKRSAATSAPAESTPADSTPSAASSTTPSSSTGTVREFTDKHGRAWRAWPVTPGQSRTGQTKHFLGEFQLGWICFEGLHDSSRRRLAGHPPRWTDLSEGELDALLERSVVAKERKSAGPAPTEALPG
jgi:hypothetical protein